jgi:hypothetical protein
MNCKTHELNFRAFVIKINTIARYSGRKITVSLGNVTVREEKKMESARGKHDGEVSEHV